MIGINGEQRQVVVGGGDELYSSTLRAKNLNWIAVERLEQPMEVTAKIRNRHTPAAALIERAGEDEVLVTFREPQRAITPGQAVVFYQDEIVVGGGWIV